MPENLHWEECDSDTWAMFLSQFNCYGTEPENNVLLHKDSDTQEPLGQVCYMTMDGKLKKRYHINKAAKAAKFTTGCSPCRTVGFRAADIRFTPRKA
jgi:hypothetical protein